MNYENWVGKRIFKKSEKEFKSGRKLAVVLAYIQHYEINKKLKIERFQVGKNEFIVCFRCELADE